MSNESFPKSATVLVENLVVSDGGTGIEINLPPARFGISEVVHLSAPDSAIAVMLLDRLAEHRLLFNDHEAEYVGECVDSAKRLRTLLSETLTQLRPDSELRPLVNSLRAHVHSFLDELRALFRELQRQLNMDRSNITAGARLTDDQIARVKHYERLGNGDLFANQRLNIMDLEPEGYRFLAAEMIGTLRGRFGMTLGALCAKFAVQQVPADLAKIVPLTQPELLEITLDGAAHFSGDFTRAAELILRADAARASGEQVAVKVVAPHETELRTKISGEEHAGEVAKAKLSLAKLEERVRSLEALLHFFLVDGRFRSAWLPLREQAAICLVSLINDNSDRHVPEPFTRLDLFPENEPSIGTSIMVPTSELNQLALDDGCESIEIYKKKLLALRSDTLITLPTHLQLELAYPAILREIVRLKKTGRLKEDWLRPVNWAFGLG